MDKSHAGTVMLVVAAMAAVAWLLSFEGGARLKAQAKVAADSGDDATVSIGAKLTTGICPGKWQPHIPARAHMGPHRMYRHPRNCSPNFCAPHQVSRDWLWNPPSEGDL